MDHLPKNQKFGRLRIGIGLEGRKPIDYVLNKFSGNEQEVLNDVFKFGSEVMRVYLHRGMSSAELLCNSHKKFELN